MVWNINEGKEDAQVVFALEIADARVYIFGMETVVLETVATALAMIHKYKQSMMNVRYTNLRKSAQVVKPRT